MVEMTLREYLEEIENLAEDGAFDAVISHCQHILKVQPRYLPAYSLMGKTALEMDDLEAAADLFSRVLSMDPEDFVARVGMSIASDKEGSVDQAVWHMERAYELAPDNQAISSELRRLYGRRDGVEPEKIALTQGALARLHSRGNLLHQAINEFRELLALEPDRVDLEVALAETLWRADRRIEAAETSLALVEKLPYCLKANLILGEIWSSSGREVEGAAHLKRAQTIDPENGVAQELFGERSPLGPTLVHIARMEYVAPPAPAEQEPDWLQTLVRDSAGPEPTDEAVPDWLQAVATSAAADEMPADAEVSQVPDLVPDWLQDVAATADVETEAFVSEPEISAAEPADSEMPEWLAALTAETEDVVAEPLSPDEIPASAQVSPADEEADAFLEEPPEWLDQIVPSEPAEEIESVVTEESEIEPGELPDWLAAMATDETQIVEADSERAEIVAEEELDIEPDEVPDWLAAMATDETQISEADRAPAEIVAEGEFDIEPGELPDWLEGLAPDEAQISEVEAPVDEELEPELGELPDWLAETAAADESIGEADDLDLAPAEIPDWLADMAPPETASTAVSDLDVAPAEVPDWLAAEEPTVPEPATEQPPEEVEETPDWLSELVEAAGATMEEETPTPEGLVEPDEALPEWLVETGEDEPVPYPEQEVPDISAEALMPADIESEAETVPGVVQGAIESEETMATGPIVIEEPEKERLVYPEGAGGEVTEAEAELLANLEDMSPEEAFAAWEAMLAQTELEEEAEPELDAISAEAAATTGPIIIEEPEKERLVYPEGAGGEVTEAEAELLADIEDMSPEEAFAAWEAMLAEGETEEAVSEPEEIEPAAPEAIVPEITEEQAIAAAPAADVAKEETVADAEAELLADLEDMSPEEAFAAWEAMLAEGETEEAVSEPEEIEPAAPEAFVPGITEEQAIAAAAAADVAEEETVADAEAELLADLEDMSPEEAFAAWEATLAEGEMEEAVSEPEEIELAAPEAIVPEIIEEQVIAAAPAADGAEEETVADAEAELLADLEDMSPEEAFAAWEAMLAEGEMEEAVSEPEEIEPAAPEAIVPEIFEEQAIAAAPAADVAEEETVADAEAELLADLEDMSPEEAFAAWEAMLAEGEMEEAVSEPEAIAAAPEADVAEEETVADAEAELLADLEEMSPEEAFAAWEAMLAEGEEEETVADAETELLADIEEMSPEEASAAWEAMLAEGEEEETAVTEAELAISLEDMSPEETLAAWEAVLAEGEEEKALEPEVVLSLEELEELEETEWPKEEAPDFEAMGFEALEESILEDTAEDVTEAEALSDEEEQTLAAAEAELLASLEDLSPEEAQAAWEALVAEDELDQVVIEEEAPPVEPSAEAEGIWVPLEEDEAEEAAVLIEPVTEAPHEQVEADAKELIDEAAAELDDAWMPLVEDEAEEAVALAEPVTEAPHEQVEADAKELIDEAAAELDDAWMPLVEDEAEEAVALAEPVTEAPREQVDADAEKLIDEAVAELDDAWMTLAEDEVEEAIAAPEIRDEVPTAEFEAEFEAVVEPDAQVEEVSIPEKAVAEPEPEAEAVEFEAVTEIPVTPAPEETVPAAEEYEVEDLKLELPVWATAKAVEPIMPIPEDEPEDAKVGPDAVFLTEEEEAEVKAAQERFAAPEPVETVPVEEPTEEEIPPDDVELVGRPTWVALEEEPVAQVETPVVEVHEAEMELIEPDDDESRLELARQLWAKGKKQDARLEYESLLRTPLREEVTADLERWAEESPDEPLLRLLGDAYIKQDRLDEALEAYRRALSAL